MKKISIKQIAELAKVSKTTVSFVLNNRGDEKNISQETQERILAIAKANNYQANYIARSLSLGKSETIAFIVPDISNPFYGKIAKHIESYAEKEGYSVMVANHNESFEKEQQLLAHFNARQIDGVIIASAARNYAQIKATADKQLPLVYFDRIFKEQKHACVDIDNAEAMKKLTQSLIDKSHKNIGLISLTSYLPNINERIEGFKAALKENNIPFNSDYFFEIDQDNRKEEINTAINRLIMHPQPVSAIVFINNTLTTEAIWAINMNHQNMTDQLQLACFDHIDMFDYSRPPVSSILQPAKEIAANCFNILIQQIKDQTSLEKVNLKTKIFY